MKLNKAQKEVRKDMIAAMKSRDFLASICNITFAVEITSSNMAKVSWARHSPNDGKFRRKTGEFVALARMNACNSLPLGFVSEEELISKLYHLADLI